MFRKITGPWMKTIRFRLLAFGITMSVIPLLVIGLYYTQVSKESAEAAVNQQQVMISLRVSNAVSDLVKMLQGSLETVALVNVDVFEKGSRQERDYILHSVLRQTPYIEELSMVSIDGQELTRISKRTAVSEEELTNISDRMEYQAIKEGQVYLSKTEISADNQVVAVLTVPVAGDNRRLGGLVARISLRPALEELSSVSLTEGSYIMLVDQDGLLIGHSDYSQVLRGQDVTNSQGVKNLMAQLADLDSIYDTEPTPLNYKSYTGEKVIGVYGIVPNTNWGIVVEQPQAIAYKALTTMIIRLALAALIVIAVLIFLTIFFSFQFLGPVQALSAGIARVKEGDLDNPIPVTELDEISRTIEAFNDMTAELKKKRLQEQIVTQNEKQAAIGLLAAGVAHEINNPMNNLSFYANDLIERIECEGMESLEEQGVVSEYMGIISQQIERCSSITRSLLNFARDSKGEIHPLHLEELIEDTIRLVDYRIKKQNIKLSYIKEESLPQIEADSSEIQQLLLNLITNALDSMKKGGSLQIDLAYKEDLGHLVLKIKDSGIGISSEDMKKIYDPFFTSKPVGEGTGLGLAISQSILRRINGEIKIESQEGAGTLVEVSIPISKAKVEGGLDE